MRGPTRQEWIEWRVKMGARKAEAAALWDEHSELLQPLTGQKAKTYYSPKNGIVHLDKLHRWAVRYDQQEAWRAFLDTLPRKPYAFLAMVAANERKREVKAAVSAKRSKGRERYLRRHKQPRPGCVDQVGNLSCGAGGSDNA